MITLRSFTLSFFLCVLPTVLAAHTYYVAAGGSDRNPGTADQPFGSLSFAAGSLEPGSTVIVAEGTYQGPVRIDVVGTQEKPIVFHPAEGAKVVIDGTGMPAGEDLVVIFGDYVAFEGFEVANAPHVGISLWGTVGVLVKDNTVHGSQGSGIWVGYNERLKSRLNIIEENIVYDNALENRMRLMESGWPSGIEISASDDTVLRGNQIYRHYGEGISVLSAQDVLVEGNLVYDCYSVNIYIDNSRRVTARENTSGTSRDPEYYHLGRPALGLAIADKEAPIAFASRDNKIVNNLFVGVSGAVVNEEFGTAEGIASHVIADNEVRRGVIHLK